MTVFKVCRIAGVAIAATLFGPNASASPALDDDDSVGEAEVSGDIAATAMAEDEVLLLDDRQIAAVTDAINTGEIEQAHLALVRSRDPEVRAFARKMIVDHAEMKRQQRQLLAHLGIEPNPNPVSARIVATGEEASAVLNMHTGMAFDILYLHGQIKAHRAALELLERHLIPSAQEPAFRALLLHARLHVAEHLAFSRAFLLRLGERP